jgi:hypothetical protein
MKTTKFKFEHTVVEVVETTYTYKIEAKSYTQAEKKLKEAIEKKIRNGDEFKPVKKYLNKIKLVDVVPVLPEAAGKSTLVINYVPGKKEKLPTTLLFNNQENVWNLLSNPAESEPVS